MSDTAVVQKQTGAELAQAKRGVVSAVAEQMRSMVSAGELHLPENYSAENASKSAWLILQGTKDKNNNAIMKMKDEELVLTGVVTAHSIRNALWAMFTQGLDPGKGQCYFIVYGNQLVCQRSYFGAIAVYKRACGQGSEIWAEVVYEGDELEYTIENGRKHIKNHTQKLENVDNSKIVAVYAVAEPEGRERRTEIMPIDKVKRAWEMGATKGKSPAHTGFTDEMAKKTVIQRVLKILINSADDSHLVMAARSQDSIVAEAETEAMVTEEGNAEMLSLAEPKDVKDVSPTTEDSTPQEEASEEPPEKAEATTKEKFQALVDENKFDIGIARRLAAEMSGIGDLRQLSNDMLENILTDTDRFVAEYLKRNPPTQEGGQQTLSSRPGF